MHHPSRLATWEQAQLEIAQAQGFTASDVTALSKGVAQFCSFKLLGFSFIIMK